MKTLLIFLLPLLLCCKTIYSQESNFKEKAMKAFESEHYDEAISYMKKALEKSPEDADIYYYLGFFTHYRAYDSRPLVGYDLSYSEQILEYLDKALELNPYHGNAKYFYGTQCGSLAFDPRDNIELQNIKFYYSLAFDKGAFPEWLLEFGRNMLNSCEENSILFVGGDADFNTLTYLQIHENYRTDITLIPIGFIERPWYISFLREGLDSAVKKIDLNIEEYHILNIRPYKWRSTPVNIPISSEQKELYNLDKEHIFQLIVEPDLFSERIHRKTEEEEAILRSYLSPQRAMLLQIIEDNFENRPIHFSHLTNPTFFGGLEMFFMNCGLTSRLMPFETQNTEYAFNVSQLENLFTNNNHKSFRTIKDHDIPRISRIVRNYHIALYHLANIYKEKENTEKLNCLILYYKENLKIGFYPEYEELILNELLK